MAHIFYDHLINWQKLHQNLNTLGLSGEERIELVELIEESLHTEILILILDQLPKELHDEYVERFSLAPHDPAHFIFISLHCRVSIDELIRVQSDAFFDELIDDFLQE